MKIFSVAAAIFAVSLSAAIAQDAHAPPKPTPEEIAGLKATNQEIVARSPDTDGVFVVQDDGTIKHLQSGLVCPAQYSNVTFFSALVFPSAAGKGLDVGCDYRRANDRGGANAKLTIFATKMAPEVTLDQAFEGYRREIAQTQHDVKAVGPALRVEYKNGVLPGPEFRSEEYSISMNSREHTSQLIVAIVSGWTIEIRATFAGKPNVVEITKEDGPDAPKLWAGDRVMSALAFIAATGSIGK
jgi:hypothetical protein